MSRKRKNKSKRSEAKYPALTPDLNLRGRSDLIDYDYIDKLTDDEKAWLNKFTEEYVNTTLDRHNLENNLHNTEKLKQDCDARSNARRRDVMVKSKLTKQLDYLEDLYIKELETNTEDLEQPEND